MKRVKGLLAVFLLSFLYHPAYAQVEIYRGDPQDTAKYIAPEDTITRPPIFGNDPDYFYYYLQTRLQFSQYGNFLTYFPENVQFSFYVERNGSVSDFKVIFTDQMMLSNAIEKIVTQMPDWKPGKQDGRKKRTLMVYNINVQLVNDVPNILVTKNSYQTTFSNKQKSLKWFLVAGSVIIMVTLWITKH